MLFDLPLPKNSEKDMKRQTKKFFLNATLILMGSHSQESVHNKTFLLNGTMSADIFKRKKVHVIQLKWTGCFLS